jgi:hypothetical protein
MPTGLFRKISNLSLVSFFFRILLMDTLPGVIDLVYRLS